MEKTKIRFPHTPTVSQGSTQIMATAYDRATAYTFTGYYPPIGNIDAYALFDQMLSGVSAYPYSVLYHSIYENTSGNLVLEYTAQDGYRNYIVRSLTVVTPFNAYTLQCVHPLGAYERYTYFRDSFYIYCECGN
ncbi:MAG: hypothetical protein H7A36_00735 [Chlamydiales bacterium]|nr:hypothetical protein [Chlamydiales bacterium]